MQHPQQEKPQFHVEGEWTLDDYNRPERYGRGRAVAGWVLWAVGTAVALPLVVLGGLVLSSALHEPTDPAASVSTVARAATPPTKASATPAPSSASPTSTTVARAATPATVTSSAPSSAAGVPTPPVAAPSPTSLGSSGGGAASPPAAPVSPPTPTPTTAAPAPQAVVTVPSVIGDAPDAAGGALFNAGLSGSQGSCSVSAAAPTAPGTVTSQTPAAGSQVPKGATVTYTVAIAPTPANPSPCG